MAENGARVVLSVSTSSVTTLDQAVRAADPGGRYATPVVVEQPPGVGAARTVAVDPQSFAAVASWGRSGATPSTSTLESITPGRLPPVITITGATVKLQLGGLSLTQLAVPTQPGEGRGRTRTRPRRRPLR